MIELQNHRTAMPMFVDPAVISVIEDAGPHACRIYTAGGLEFWVTGDARAVFQLVQPAPDVVAS